MQLNESRSSFEDLGVNLVAVSYDKPEAIANFVDSKSIEFPLLSDVETQTVQAFGILNETVKADSPAYGIPHPGMVMVDAEGAVVFKRALPSYRDRPDVEEIISAIGTDDSDSEMPED